MAVNSYWPMGIEGEGVKESETERAEELRGVPRAWDWEEEMRDLGVRGRAPSMSVAMGSL